MTTFENFRSEYTMYLFFSTLKYHSGVILSSSTFDKELEGQRGPGPCLELQSLLESPRLELGCPGPAPPTERAASCKAQTSISRPCSPQYSLACHTGILGYHLHEAVLPAKTQPNFKSPHKLQQDSTGRGPLPLSHTADWERWGY